jgi:hypothetical protein
VVGRAEMDDFLTRVLDFGRVIEAGDEPALEAAGLALAAI